MTELSKMKLGNRYQYRDKNYDYRFIIFGISDNDKKVNILIEDTEPYLFNVTKKEILKNLDSGQLKEIKKGNNEN